MNRPLRVLIAAFLLLALPAGAAEPAWVGSATCTGCHAAEAAAWRGSQHAAAMQAATPETVLGDFNGARFEHVGTQSRFSHRDGRFVVRTEGADGKPADFTLPWTFGVAPLQQYLATFPDGRLQALGIAWDSRPRAQGGQRWFHLYPGERIPAGDELHWTGLQQNWNYMCADCHVTGFRKNYDAATDRFASRWTETGVGCEACHGPGSVHAEAARAPATSPAWSTPGRGLTAALTERRGVSWQQDPAGGLPRRSAPRTTSTEIGVCAPCHARRAQIGESYRPGDPVGDAYLVSLLDEGLYWPDGQMRDEVFNHGSFLQSRMHAAGVTCSDCHEPHGGTLRAQGNAVCAQCHAPARFDTPAHHRHAAGSTGAACTACHMPATTYMVVDPRHDHGFRVPRPDLSAATGSPDACSSCHADRGRAWILQQFAARHPKAAGFQRFGESFAAWDGWKAGARNGLLTIAADTAQPAIVRASALSRLQRDPLPDTAVLARRGLQDPDELVRRASVDLMLRSDPRGALQALPPALRDPVRAVRITAARALAGLPPGVLPAAAQPPFDAALAEYRAAQAYNADRPESRLALAALDFDRGDPAAAETTVRAVLQRHPGSVTAAVNLADLLRARGDEAGARAELQEALSRSPRDPALHHALGLALARSGDSKGALSELAKAAELGPQDPRYAYVLGVAQHSYGNAVAAIATLESAARRFPGDRSILQALATMNRDAGNLAKAADYAARLVAEAPADPQARALREELARATSAR